MGTVAKRLVLRMFASAPGHRFGLGNVGFDWPETASFVRAVAKRLRFGPPAGTPPIGRRFHLLHERKLLDNDRFAHEANVIVLIFKAIKFQQIHPRTA
jgi:hypothetical protein